MCALGADLKESMGDAGGVEIVRLLGSPLPHSPHLLFFSQDSVLAIHLSSHFAHIRTEYRLDSYEKKPAEAVSLAGGYVPLFQHDSSGRLERCTGDCDVLVIERK